MTRSQVVTWVLETDGTYGDQPRIVTDEPNSRLVAVVGNADLNNQDQWEEDARFIAASRDMAAACELLWKQLSQSDNRSEWAREALDAGYAALQKAGVFK